MTPCDVTHARPERVHRRPPPPATTGGGLFGQGDLGTGGHAAGRACVTPCDVTHARPAAPLLALQDDGPGLVREHPLATVRRGPP
ncbi:hypothetical protein WBG99_19285 [Streptomyces sp. TG1A-60]|uniref:hypothetical protein n=1 Tax=Streptomyces sp. TG1A-60 TaxID=3129111 RepID=UPI0030CE6B27